MFRILPLLALLATPALAAPPTGSTWHAEVVETGGPVLGVQVLDPTPQLRQLFGGEADQGVLIGAVSERSAAQRAGVQVGDLLVSVGDEPVMSSLQLRRILHRSAETEVELMVLRDGKKKTLRAKLDEGSDGPVRRSWSGQGSEVPAELRDELERTIRGAMEGMQHWPPPVSSSGPADARLQHAIETLTDQMQQMERRIERLQDRLDALQQDLDRDQR